MLLKVDSDKYCNGVMLTSTLKTKSFAPEEGRKSQPVQAGVIYCRLSGCCM